MSEYNSSEELQHHKLDVFARAEAEKKKEITSDSEKVKRVLDKYIKKHESTKNVRNLAKENNRTADYQLDLSADLVDVLQKIKSELG